MNCHEVPWFAPPVILERIVVREAYQFGDKQVSSVDEADQQKLGARGNFRNRPIYGAGHLREVPRDRTAAAAEQGQIRRVLVLLVAAKDPLGQAVLLRLDGGAPRPPGKDGLPDTLPPEIVL